MTTLSPGDWTAIIACAVLAYLCGSIPFGLLLARAGGHGDIRAIGSGNIGATNVLRTGNKKLAAATLLCDLLKGVVPVAIAWRFGAETAAVAAVFAPLGHIFPIWLRFKGGKGVATAGGALLAYAWPVALAAIATWLVVAFIFRYSSLAAVIATVMAPVYAWLMLPAGISPLPALLIALLVVWRHRSNITRLAQGKEDKIALRKKHA